MRSRTHARTSTHAQVWRAEGGEAAGMLTDSGAQYVTIAEGVEALPAHAELYAELRSAGILPAGLNCATLP